MSWRNSCSSVAHCGEDLRAAIASYAAFSETCSPKKWFQKDAIESREVFVERTGFSDEGVKPDQCPPERCVVSNTVCISAGDMLVKVRRLLKLFPDGMKVFVRESDDLAEVSDSRVDAEGEIRQTRLRTCPLRMGRGQRRLSIDFGEESIDPMRRTVINLKSAWARHAPSGGRRSSRTLLPGDVDSGVFVFLLLDGRPPALRDDLFFGRIRSPFCRRASSGVMLLRKASPASVSARFNASKAKYSIQPRAAASSWPPNV